MALLVELGVLILEMDVFLPLVLAHPPTPPPRPTTIPLTLTLKLIAPGDRIQRFLIEESLSISGQILQLLLVLLLFLAIFTGILLHSIHLRGIYRNDLLLGLGGHVLHLYKLLSRHHHIFRFLTILSPEQALHVLFLAHFCWFLWLSPHLQNIHTLLLPQVVPRIWLLLPTL